MGLVSRREDEARNGQRGEKKRKMPGGPGCAGEGVEPLVGSIRKKNQVREVQAVWLVSKGKKKKKISRVGGGCLEKNGRS